MKDYDNQQGFHQQTNSPSNISLLSPNQHLKKRFN